MNHLPYLITDLALILGVASIITIIFKWLKQPLILGYIIAGLIISPNFHLFPDIYEVGDVHIWGEIGVIFLLFSLGLEFSFKKLAKLGGSASTAAGFEAIGMGVIGFFIGKILGWPLMDSVFLGACLTISSSSVIIKTFEDLGLKQKNFAGLVFGVLVVEDLIAVILLVVLGTFADSQTFDGTRTLLSIIKLAFFLLIWFIGGIFLIPSLLKKARRFLNDETLLIVSVAMCFLMVYLSSQAGFSAALGAFIMGSLLAETTKAERIEHLVKPVRDLFGAIFFISVGMLIDISSIGEYIVPILLITAAVVVGKSIVISLGAYLAGNSLKTALQTGMSLALIGEFSFLIASLGKKMNATGEQLYPIIITVSALTVFIAPYLTLASTPLYNFINRRLSNKWQQRLNRYSAAATELRTISDWHSVLKSFLKNVIIFSAILIAVIILSNTYLLPWLKQFNYNFVKITAAVISLIFMSPFIWALMVRNEKTSMFASIYSQKKYVGPIWIMRGIKLALALLFIFLLLQDIFSISIALYTAAVIITLIIIFRKRLQKMYDGIEERFIQNLNNREIEEQKLMADEYAARRNTNLAPWDAHLTTFEVPSEAIHIIGQTLEALQWRERVGINIALIKRGLHTIVAPQRHEKIYPHDKLYIICTDSQERKMNALLRPDKRIIRQATDVEMKLERFVIEHDSPFLHQTIHDSDIRNKAHGLVVGVEREGERLLNPKSTWVFEEGDVVWIVGEKKLIEAAISG